MKTIKIRNWKKLDRHSLSGEYPDLTPAGREQMRASLKEHGIVGDRKITLFEGKVLDGWQLYQACIEEDIEPQFQELVDGDPAAFVEILNDCRRHEDTETIRLRAEKRRERVVAARQQGQSTRAISEAEGISQTQVLRDLAASGEPPGSPDGKVTGADGKTYAAQQLKLIPEIVQMDLSPKIISILEALPRGKQLDFARYVHDGMLPRAALKEVEDQREPGEEATNGKPRTKGHAPSRAGLEAFNVAKFEELDSLVRQLEKGIDELVRSPGGEQLLRFTQAHGDEHKTVRRSEHLQALKRDLAGTRPHSICPWCVNKPTKGCTKCSGAGWITKTTWRDAPEEVKARLT
jgi:hypothetical protein